MEDKPAQEEPAVRRSNFRVRDDLPDVRARDELTTLLRTHDLPESVTNFAQLTDEHAALLRKIAQESGTSNTNPTLRRKAITALGHWPSLSNLKVLRAVAEGDDDRAVRVTALTALAHCGMESEIPLLLAALGSPDPVESVTAGKGLLTLAARLGPDVVAHALPSEQALESADDLPREAGLQADPTRRSHCHRTWQPPRS
jgi:HEAT repeat protein